MKRIIAAGFILCLSCQSQAVAPLVSLQNTFMNRFYVSAGAGYLFNNLSGSNSLGTGAGWPNDYYGSNKITNEPFGFMEAGFAWQRPENWFPGYSVGVRYLSASSTKVSGYINQYSLPAFYNYNFSYDVQLSNLMGILKADIYRLNNVMPYLLVGAGAGVYSASNYTEQATSGVTPRVSPAFASTSGTNFSYQLGAGIDVAVWKTVSINFEYDYIHYGTVQTGKGVNYTTATGTNYSNESLQNKINANTLLLGLTYYPE